MRIAAVTAEVAGLARCRLGALHWRVAGSGALISTLARILSIIGGKYFAFDR